MENTPLEPAHTIFCRACSAKVAADDTFCTNCGYPLHGTEEEQRHFVSVRDAKLIDFSEASRKIRRASITLYVIGALTVLGGLAMYAIADDPTVKETLLITNLILGAIYVGLGFWCTRKPMAAIISGLSLYLLTFILNAVSDPSTIAKSIIFKIIIIGLFIAGIKSAIEAEKLKKELNAE